MDVKCLIRISEFTFQVQKFYMEVVCDS